MPIQHNWIHNHCNKLQNLSGSFFQFKANSFQSKKMSSVPNLAAPIQDGLQDYNKKYQGVQTSNALLIQDRTTNLLV